MEMENVFPSTDTRPSHDDEPRNLSQKRPSEDSSEQQSKRRQTTMEKDVSPSTDTRPSHDDEPRNLSRKRPFEDCSEQQRKRSCTADLMAALLGVQETLEKKNKKNVVPQETKKRSHREVGFALRGLSETARVALQGSHDQKPIDCITSVKLPLHIFREAIEFAGAYMENLTEVTVKPSPSSGSTSCDLDLTPLFQLQRLESLGLFHCRLHRMETVEGQLQSLKRLKLYRCQAVSPQWVQLVAKVTTLEEVTLERCTPSLKDCDLESLREGLPNLRDLTIGFNCETVDLKCLSGNSRLQTLNLKNVDFGRETNEDSWEGLPCLKSMHLDACGPLTIVTPYVTDIATLEELCVDNSTVRGRAAYDISLARLSLSKLTLRHCEVDGKCWAAISKMETLRTLTIAGELSDEGLKQLAEGQLSLKCLALERCSRITQQGLQNLMSGQRKSLKSICIKGCKRISKDWYLRVTKSLPCLEEATCIYEPFV